MSIFNQILNKVDKEKTEKNMDERNMSIDITMKSKQDQENVDDINANVIDADNVRPFIRDSIYYAAKDGLSINLCSLLSNIENDDTKNAIINQVSDQKKIC